MYYCDHFDEVESVVDSFDREDAQSIANAQPLFADAQIRADLAYIKANFSSRHQKIGKTRCLLG